MYLEEQHVYPEPLFLPAISGCGPTTVNARLLNELGPYLRTPTYSGAESTTQLAQFYVCPMRAQIDLFQQPSSSFGVTYWLTGYMYCGRLDDAQNTNGTILNAAHIAHARGRSRGVLWADTLAYTVTPAAPMGYSYFHYNGGLNFNPAFGTLNTYSSWTCQHRAWSDGSVEEINSAGVNLDPAVVNTSASYKISVPGAFDMYVYF
jgi:hypothetical protein